MDITMVDVLIHIDEGLTPEQRGEVENRLRGIDGVISVHNPDKTPHLTLIGYRPDKTGSQQLLQMVRADGIHAELVGL